MKEKLKEVIKYIELKHLVMVLFILQPFIDMYRAFFESTISIFGIAIEEAINMAFVGLLFIIVICKKIKEKKSKTLIKYIIYILLLTIYFVLHYLNIAKFNTAIYEKATPNFIIETYYTIRTYVIPIVLIWIVYNSYMKDKDFNRTIKIVAAIISMCIVLTNIFQISLVSYSGQREMIKGSIFEWITLQEGASYGLYTSRGFFESANQISALLLSLMPIVVMDAIKKQKLEEYILVAVQVLALIMIGTRTASLGGLLVLVAMIFITIVLKIIKLEKELVIKTCIPVLCFILIIGAAIYNISPGRLKQISNQVAAEESRPDAEESLTEDGQSSLEERPFEEYVNKYAYNYFIKKDFLEMYPANNDEEFWKEIMSRDKKLNISNRSFKMDLIERIIQRNDNKADKILGIGYTSNIPYTERDYAYQYYIYGILGEILLIAPVIIIVVYAIYKCLRYYKKKINLQNCAIGFSLCCLLLSAYLSGHVFGIIINMYFMSLYAGKLLYNMKNEE